MVNVCGVAATANILEIGPVKPPSRYCSHVVSFFCDEVLPLLLIAVEADAQNHQRLSLKFLGDLFHVGQSFAARPAPCRPEVEQNYFPRQIVHRDPLSIRGRDRKRRRQSCLRQLGLADIAQRPLSVWITFRAKFHELFEAGVGRIVLLQLCQEQSIRVEGAGKFATAASAVTISSWARVNSSSLCFSVPSSDSSAPNW